MTVYIESSAVLTWLLGEPRAAEVRNVLSSAAMVMTSDLTLVECDRVLIRAAAAGDLTEAEAAHRRAAFQIASAHWTILRLGSDVVERARQRFPREPVRTLDALHLSSALVAKAALSDLVLASLDDRVRTNGEALGFELRPVA